MVTLKKDTLYGDLRFGLNGRASKLVTSDTTYSINPDNTNSYFYSNSQELYRSRAYPGKKKLHFILCFISGPISLYMNITPQYMGSAGVSGNDYPVITPVLVETKWTNLYAEKKEGILIEVKTKSLFADNGSKRAAFFEMIGDSPEVIDIYNEDGKFAYGDVVYYVREYNKRANKKR